MDEDYFFKFTLSVIGSLCQLHTDWVRHRVMMNFVWLTRITYHAMTLYFMFCWLGVGSVDFRANWLNTFGPISLTVFFSYYFFLQRKGDENAQADSLFGHLLMPLMTLFELFEDRSVAPPFLFLLIIFPYGMHYCASWALFHRIQRFPYKVIPTHLFLSLVFFLVFAVLTKMCRSLI